MAERNDPSPTDHPRSSGKSRLWSRVNHARRAAPLVLLLLLLVTHAGAVEFPGRVVGVTSGDTLKVVVDDAVQVTVRLRGIDAPGTRQPFGNQAKAYALELGYKQKVTVQTTGKDRNGQIIAEVTLRDGRSLNREMVRAGLAWWHRQYAPRELALEAAEQEARDARRGVWSQNNPVPPWEWKKPPRR